MTNLTVYHVEGVNLPDLQDIVLPGAIAAIAV